MRKLYAAYSGHLMAALVLVAAITVLDAMSKPYDPDLVGSPRQILIVLATAGIVLVAGFEWARWYNRKRGVNVTLAPQDLRAGVHWPTFKNGLWLGAVFMTIAGWNDPDTLLTKVIAGAIVGVVLAFVMAVLVRLLLSPSPVLRLPRRRKARSTSPQPRPPAAAARPSSSE